MGDLWSAVYEAFVIMIIGMTNVFLMLTIAMFGMMLIGYFAAPDTAKKQKTKVSDASSAPLEVPAESGGGPSEDELALIAASVAVAHHNLQKSKSVGLIIRKDVEV